MTYSQKLRDPRWQKKRLHILELNGWRCAECGSTTKNLQVHHVIYCKLDPWDYPDESLQVFCSECHEERQEIADDVANALKMSLKDVPTAQMRKAAMGCKKETRDLDKMTLEASLAAAWERSVSGLGVLDHKLFQDVVMAVFSSQAYVDEKYKGDMRDFLAPQTVILLRQAADKIGGVCK